VLANPSINRQSTITRSKIVFLLDVDNTLMDNDAVTEDLRRHLVAAFGADREQEYWAIFEELRREIGYADYLGALQRYRSAHPTEPQLLRISLFLLHYPFASRLYPRALDVVRRLRAEGPVVILSDGDVVFQPRKIERSGLWAAVDGEVLIYIHKEAMLGDVERRYPADRYVIVDDKLKILTAVKSVWGDRVTTMFVRQGHYANDPQLLADYPAADLTIDSIASLLETAGGRAWQGQPSV
jgi:FMN phosphatase YigB (HAD superfamily)